MPENVHTEVDLLRCDLGMAPAEIIAFLRGMSALGISIETRDNDDGHMLLGNS